MALQRGDVVALWNTMITEWNAIASITHFSYFSISCLYRALCLWAQKNKIPGNNNNQGQCLQCYKIKPIQESNIGHRRSFDTPLDNWWSCFSGNCITDMELSSTGSHVVDNTVNI